MFAALIRTARLLLLVIFACALASQSARSTPASAPLARLAATSGCTAWERIGALHFRGRTVADGFAGPDTSTYDARSGAYVDRWDNGHFPSRSGYDGRAPWSVDPSGANHVFNAPFSLALARTDAWIDRQGWCEGGGGGATVTKDAQVAEHGHLFEVLSVSIPHASGVELWLDENGHLARTVEQQIESRVETRFGDIRDIAGVPIAFRIESHDLSTGDLTTTSWNSVIATAAISKIAYQPPPQPRDYSRFAATTVVPAHFEGPKIFVDAIINGRGPFPLILDTGGHLVLTPETAARLGLVASGRVLGTGAGSGIVREGFAKVSELRLGGAVLKNQNAKVFALHYGPGYRGPRPHVAGVIGLELFERYAVTIDPGMRTVTLANFEHVSRKRGIPLPILFAEDAPMIAGTIEGHEALLEIDTGNGSGSTIIEPLFAARTGIARVFGHGPTSGGSGVGGAYTSSLGRVRIGFGPVTLSRERAELVHDAAGADATVVTAANIGTSVLSRFVQTFDYRDGLMLVRPVPGATATPVVSAGIAFVRLGDGTYRVAKVVDGSAAALAGLRVGTVIHSVAGHPSATLGTVDIGQLEQRSLGRPFEMVGSLNGTTRIYTLRLREELPDSIVRSRRRAPGVQPKAALKARDK